MIIKGERGPHGGRLVIFLPFVTHILAKAVTNEVGQVTMTRRPAIFLVGMAPPTAKVVVLILGGPRVEPGTCAGQTRDGHRLHCGR